MQSVTMTDEIWSHLKGMRDGSVGPIPISRSQFPSLSLYGPIAERKGPFVVAQVGQSLDGRVATLSGDAQNVSGCDGITHLHRCRALVDAVVVGVGTVVADDPRLSVRVVSGRNPVRVVVDCNGRMPADARVLHDGGTPVVVIQADDVPGAGRAEVLRLPRRHGILDPRDILEALAALGLTTVLVEGGAKTISRFIEADLVDRLHVSISPIIIGAGPAGISLPPVDRLSQARRPEVQVYNIGTDVVFDCNLRRTAENSRTSGESEDVLVADTA